MHPWERVRGTLIREEEGGCCPTTVRAQRQGEDAGLDPAPRSFICLPRATLVASSCSLASLEDSMGKDTCWHIIFYLHFPEAGNNFKWQRESHGSSNTPQQTSQWIEVSAQQFLDSCFPFLYYSAQCTQIF